MSEFRAIFAQSFAIHAAISAALAEAEGPNIDIAAVISNLDQAGHFSETPDLVAAISAAAQEIGIPIIIGETSISSPTGRPCPM